MATNAPKRIAAVLGIKPEHIAQYEAIHREVWPTVLATLKRNHVQNFSIYRYENLLFSYMEYTGSNYEEDMAAIASDPETKRWWAVTEPLQSKVLEAGADEWWHEIPEKFHLD
jgi:L-rhamnose mutarotase